MNITEVSTPYKYSASDRRVKPVSLVVLHYTAAPYYHKHPSGSNSGRIRNWLAGVGRQSSTHFVVLRDGAIMQAAGMDERTWHSGGSKFKPPQGKSIEGINFKSIGVDFDNVGMLYKVDGGFVNSYERHAMRKHKRKAKRFYRGPEPYAHETSAGVSYWEPYSPESIDSMKLILWKILEAHPKLVGDPWRIVGHSDIKSTKSDPGPACPTEDLRSVFLPDFDPSSLNIPDILYY